MLKLGSEFTNALQREVTQVPYTLLGNLEEDTSFTNGLFYNALTNECILTIHLKNGSLANNSYTDVILIPTGYRPANDVMVNGNSGGTYLLGIRVRSTGTVSVYNATGSPQSQIRGQVRWFLE